MSFENSGGFDRMWADLAPVGRHPGTGGYRRFAWTREDAEARIAAQASREDRLAVATYVIENTGTYDDLRERVAEVVEQLTG